MWWKIFRRHDNKLLPVFSQSHLISGYKMDEQDYRPIQNSGQLTTRYGDKYPTGWHCYEDINHAMVQLEWLRYHPMPYQYGLYKVRPAQWKALGFVRSVVSGKRMTVGVFQYITILEEIKEGKI
jgi:hypothetical protein